jgi:hypothetical protein
MKDDTPKTDNAEKEDAHLFQSLYPNKTRKAVKSSRLRELERECNALRSVIERMMRNYESTLAGRPVRDCEETFAEARALINIKIS